jgi:hypothetical protein
MMTTAATDLSSRKPRLFDAINVPLLVLVAICFFLPLLELDCGGSKIRFNGPSLAFGTNPSLVGGTSKDDEQLAQKLKKDDIPLDPLLVLFPLCALAGAAIAFLAFKHPGGVKTLLLVSFPAAAAVVLIAYAIIGFGPERKISEERQRSGNHDNQSMVTIEKTTWFDLALIGSCAGALLAAARRYSPVIGAAQPADALQTSEINSMEKL